MKKLLILATAAMIFTGAFAQDKKDCGTAKSCCKKDMAKKECSKKEGKSCSAKTEKVVKATTTPTKKA